MPKYSLWSLEPINFDAAPRFGTEETQEIASIKADSTEPLSMRTWTIMGTTTLVLTATGAATTTLLAF